jgi:GNAT superfamily N-acetyltransferase
MSRIEQLSPLAACEDAAALLRAAWTPPCVHYSAEYLSWQLSFPGPPPLAFGAVEADGSLSGFAGATPRRLRLNGVSDYAYLVSFVAVRPDCRGQGLAARLYAALLAEIERAERPVITFAAEGTAGDRALQQAYPASGWTLAALGPCTIHGGLSRTTSTDLAEVIAPTPDSVATLAESQTGEGVLWSAPDPAGVAHYAAGPGRRIVRVDAADGTSSVAGIVAAAEFLTVSGIVTSPIVETAFVPFPPATDGLSALVREAAALVPGGGPVLIYNLQGPEPAQLRAAGLRRTSSPYHAFLAAPVGSNHPFLKASATSLEIV